MNYKALNFSQETTDLAGKVMWRSPSNIALVKYWGKYGRQLPSNASISFTLKNAHTDMSLSYMPGTGEVVLYFDEKRNESFERRIKKFLSSIKDIYPFLGNLNIEIHSKNSFPHSAGIASSASAMSALALCLCSLEQNIFGTLKNQSDFLKKASYLSRLASGSASRSVFPKISVWGKHIAIENSSNEFAIPAFDDIHPMFYTFKNSILIASSAEKKVSSTAGHKLMAEHLFRDIRFKQAEDNLTNLYAAMTQGNLKKFIEIVEEEALTLHALMMTSTPSYILMQPNTLKIIQEIKAFRAEHELPVCFTLDAGPNIHLLYPAAIAPQVSKFVKTILQPLCENNLIIEDEVGQGAIQLGI